MICLFMFKKPSSKLVQGTILFLQDVRLSGYILQLPMHYMVRQRSWYIVHQLQVMY